MIARWQLIRIHRLHVNGMALFPFVLYRADFLLGNESFLQHEHIHLRQQRELLVLPFYVLYFIFYLANLLRYKNHSLAYRNICFEKEAYGCESVPQYLQNRKAHSWLQFIR